MNLFSLSVSWIFVSTCILTYALPPANDFFSLRVPLTGASGVVTSDTSGATLEPGEPYHFFDPNGENSLWWSWTPPASGLYAFDTKLSPVSTAVMVYEGASLTNLTRVLNGQNSYGYFNATGGKEYQVAVLNQYPNEKGTVILRYYQEQLSDWIPEISPSGSNEWMIVSPNGSILMGIQFLIYDRSHRTNRYGYDAGERTLPRSIQYGLTLITASGELLLDNEYPPGISQHYWTLTFDGRSLLLNDFDTDSLVLYRIGKDGFEKVGEQPVESLFTARIEGSHILAQYVLYDEISNAYYSGAAAYNKKLKKTKWSEAPDTGFLAYVLSSGITIRNVPNVYLHVYELAKQGKHHSKLNIPHVPDTQLEIRPDRKGGLLYWGQQGYGLNATNTPLSYISRKGKHIFENLELPDAGNLWMLNYFDGKYLYITKPAGTMNTVIGYKIGRKTQKIKALSISKNSRISVTGKQVTMFDYQTGPPTLYGFTQYDMKLNKVLWEEPLSEGYIAYIGDDTFSREWTVPMSGYTNYLYRIFNKKGTVAEHTISK